MAKEPMKPRQWRVMGQFHQDGRTFLGLDRQEVERELMDMEPVGNNIGGAFTVVPLRAKVPLPDGSEDFRTIGWEFVWQAYVPAAVVQSQEPIPELEPPEPTPVPDPAFEEPELPLTLEEEPVGAS